MLAIALSLLAVVGAPRSARAEVFEITLGRLATGADEILVGRVTCVVRVDAETPERILEGSGNSKIAQIQVRDWIKGGDRPAVVWIWASGDGCCDTTEATVGETSLFFLDASGLDDLITPAAASRVRAAADGQRVRRVAWSGRGRMPFQTIGEQTYALVRTSTVLLPSEVVTVPGPDPRYAAFIRGAPIESLRAAIARAVAEIGPAGTGSDGEVAKVLRQLHREADLAWFDVQERVDALGVEAIPALMAVVARPESPLREAAALALCCMSDRAGRQALLSGLKSEDVVVRRGAAFVLDWASTTRDPLTLEGVDRRLMESLGDADPEVRWRMLDVVTVRRFDGILSAVVGALKDGSAEVARHATLALPGVVRTLARTPEERVLLHEAEAQLQVLVMRKDPVLRRSAWEALEAIGSAASWKDMERDLSDPDVVVRIHATGALARIRSAESSRALLALLGDQDPWVRRAAARSAGLARIPEGIVPLAKALEDPDPIVRAIAVWALGEMGPPAAGAAADLRKFLRSKEGTALTREIEESLQAIEK